MRHLGDNFWTVDNFGTIWWFLSDFWQSIPLPRGQHIDIFKIRFYSILQHFERCECPICPNQKSCVTFNFQVYCSRLYLHNVHTLLTVFTQGSLKAHLDVTLGPLSTHLANFIHRWVKMDQFSILSAKTFTIYRLLLILVGLLHLPPICLEFCKHFVTCMQA